jgi:site-specific recombinase XerD
MASRRRILSVETNCAPCASFSGGIPTAPLCLPPSAAALHPDAVNRLVKRIGERAGFPFPVHIHMLRHACGYKLANDGHDTRAIQDWLGHRSIQHTLRYTELSQTRFKDFWRA